RASHGSEKRASGGRLRAGSVYLVHCAEIGDTTMSFPSRRRSLPALVLSVSLSFLVGIAGALMGTCGPFADVAGDSFCPFVLGIFYMGITTGTTPSTYDPTANVSRL